MRTYRTSILLSLAFIASLICAPLLMGADLPTADRLAPGDWHGTLTLQAIHPDGTVFAERTLDNLIVTAGKTLLVNCMGATGTPSCTTFETLKYHALGTGAGCAAAIGDTALGTELTTQYATANVRPTGTQTGSATTYQTVGVNTVGIAAAVTEFGLFTQAANLGGTMWTHICFSVVSLGIGDTLQSTYTLTIP